MIMIPCKMACDNEACNKEGDGYFVVRGVASGLQSPSDESETTRLVTQMFSSFAGVQTTSFAVVSKPAWYSAGATGMACSEECAKIIKEKVQAQIAERKATNLTK